MPKKLKKSLQTYLSKLRRPSAFSSTTTAKMLSGCRYPKTVSFSRDKDAAAASASASPSPSTGDCTDDPDHSATLTDIDHFLSVNFQSLYLPDKEGIPVQPGRTACNNPCESTRFFVPAVKTRSLAEEARLSSTSTMSENTAPSSTTLSDGSETPLRSRSTLQDDSVAVLRYSPEPYEDFRRSMVEMIESRYEEGAKVDWDFMEELLFCYLNLNEKRSYRYIISAFVNLIMVLQQNSVRAPATHRCRKSRSTAARDARPRCNVSFPELHG